MRHRHRSPRLVVSLALLTVLVATVVAGCATIGTGPETTSDPLPTGLVGPIAPTVGPEALRYVALGDPYTFGDGVRQSERWPNQLVRILRPQLDLDLIANLASRGAASRQLIEDQLPELMQLEPQFVSVQVGANDACLFHEGTPSTYRGNMGAILDTVLTLVEPDRVVVLTAPDFTFTLGSGGSCPGDAAQQSARIRDLNAILEDVATARGVAVVDISPISDRVPLDPSLIAADGIHPSAKQYAGWADLVAEKVRPLFREPEASIVPASEVSPSEAANTSTQARPVASAWEPPAAGSALVAP